MITRGFRMNFNFSSPTSANFTSKKKVYENFSFPIALSLKAIKIVDSNRITVINRK